MEQLQCMEAMADCMEDKDEATDCCGECGEDPAVATACCPMNVEDEPGLAGCECCPVKLPCDRCLPVAADRPNPTKSPAESMASIFVGHVEVSTVAAQCVFGTDARLVEPPGPCLQALLCVWLN
jgi:hypothetical protein